jgi:hypothetical protein
MKVALAGLVVATLAVAGSGPAFAQQSTSFKLTESTFNSGGHPGPGALGPSVDGVPFAFPVTVGEELESGAVLAADAARPGQFVLAREMADPAVVGVAAGGPQATWRGRAPLALPGTVVRCKVDASHGAIRPGDMLVTSPTPGHAMASAEATPGTVIAKALESLESGMGAILVLVQPR